MRASQLGAQGFAIDAVTVAGELLMWRPSMVAEMVYTPGCIATYWKHAAPCFIPAALTVVRLGPSTDTCTSRHLAHPAFSFFVRTVHID